MIDTSGFEDPDWTAPLDVQSYVDACLEGQTVKGVFVRSLVERAERQGKTLSRARRYIAFKDYPCAEYNLLAEECARVLEPGAPLRPTFRRFGQEAYPALRTTMFGRIIAAAAGSDVKSVFGSVPKVYSTMLSDAEGRSRVEEGRAVIELRQVPTFADSFHVGAFEGVLKDFDRPGSVRIRRHSVVDVDLLVEWS